MRGRPGVSASPMPAMTRRMEGAVLSRRATMATTTSTASSGRRVWIVAVIRSRRVCQITLHQCARAYHPLGRNVGMQGSQDRIDNNNLVGSTWLTPNPPTPRGANLLGMPDYFQLPNGGRPTLRLERGDGLP